MSKTNYYWLIEHAASSAAVPMYLTTIGGIDTQTWRDDPYKAMRFRESDAATEYAERFYLPGSVRVCLHGFDADAAGSIVKE